MKKRPIPLAIIMCALVVVGLMCGGTLEGQSLVENARVTSTIAQVKEYESAVTSFRDAYGAFPGDFANAGKALKGCTGIDGSDCNPFSSSAGDNIIGTKDFAKNWKSQVTDKTNVPAISAADETILFWAHLRLAGFLNTPADKVNNDGINKGSPIAFGTTNPAARIGGGFIVGYADGTPLPLSLAPKNQGMAGTVIELVSSDALNGKAELNAPEEQPLQPNFAAQMDQKMDDGRAATGFVQAYGSPRCFSSDKNETLWEEIKRWPNERYITKEGEYNESISENDCGLIFRIQG